MAYSFDIYDTCLTRIHARPADLFYDLGERAMLTLCPHGYGPYTIKEFVRLRKLAERLVRQEQRGQRDDISLFDIYAKFSAISPWRMNIEEMMLVELAVEKASLKPVPAMLSLVRAARTAGHKILFISDMYLPTQFLRECLEEHGFFETNDEIYVSGDVGLSKHSGKLFQHVLEKHSILPQNLVHLGDNYHADVLVPKRMGIQAALFDQLHLNRYERLSTSFINSGFFAKMVGASRLLRVTEQEPANREFARLASDVIAPLLTAFVAWLLEDAKKRGMDCLYFVSRDGQILYKIAQRLTSAWGGPECRYLYGSRQAWFLPAVTEVSRSKLNWLLSESESKTPRYIFQRLHIAVEEIEDVLFQYSLFHRLDVPMVSRDEAILWECLQHPKVASLILQNAQNSRDLAVKYFTQEGLLSPDKRWAIVDVGWTLKCQRAIQEILESNGFDAKVYGYYFGVRTSLVDVSQHGCYSALSEDGKQCNSDSLRCDGLYYAGTMALFEHAFTMSDHSTVMGYKDNGNNVVPILSPNSVKPSFEQAQTLHHIVMKYVDEGLAIGFSAKHIPDLIQCSFASFKLLITRPSVKEAKYFADFMAHIDQGHALGRPMAAPLSWTHVARIFFNQFGWLPRYELSGPVWLEGSAALSSPTVRFVVIGLMTLKLLIKRLRK